MISHRGNFFDIGKIFRSIGERALRSMRDWCTEHVDLSDWMCLAENRQIANSDHFPECYFKDLLQKIYSPQNHITWEAFLHTFDQLRSLNAYRPIGIIDLLMATTLLSPLIEKVWGSEHHAPGLMGWGKRPTKQ